MLNSDSQHNSQPNFQCQIANETFCIHPLCYTKNIWQHYESTCENIPNKININDIVSNLDFFWKPWWERLFWFCVDWQHSSPWSRMFLPRVGPGPVVWSSRSSEDRSERWNYAVKYGRVCSWIVPHFCVFCHNNQHKNFSKKQAHNA